MSLNLIFFNRLKSPFLRMVLKETRNSFKKWSLNCWWILNKTIMEVENNRDTHQLDVIFSACFNVWRLLIYRTMSSLFVQEILAMYSKKVFYISTHLFPLSRPRVIYLYYLDQTPIRKKTKTRLCCLRLQFNFVVQIQYITLTPISRGSIFFFITF